MELLGKISSFNSSITTNNNKLNILILKIQRQFFSHRW